MKATIDLIQTLMHDYRLTQAELADLIGCQQSTISRYLRGRKKPSAEITLGLITLAKKKRIKINLEDFI